MVGYSRLIHADEAGTRAALNGHRRELIDPQLDKHGGRLVSTAGDSLLVEFTSVVDAVQWAVEVQRGMSERNTETPTDGRIVFRIGINSGDVIVEGGDIHGDGVNVAARLEALADSGGVLITANVFEQVRRRLELDFEDLGDQHVKNIPEPVRVYRVLLEPGAAGKLVGQDGRRKRLLAKRWLRAIPATAAVAVIVVAAAVLLTLEPWTPRVEAASEERMAFPLPEEPSIAVLPFENLSGHSNQDYLAGGFTEEIITTLSRTPRLFVIGRSSTAIYRDKPASIREVAEELGVRHVLEGSLQKSDDRLRVTARLIDALSGRQMWAERYDRELMELFAVQDDITHRIVESLQVELTTGEQGRMWRRSTESLEAFEALLRCRDLHLRNDPDTAGEARDSCLRAIEIDPGFSTAYVGVGFTYIDPVVSGTSQDPTGDLDLGSNYAEEAIRLDGESALAHGLMSFVLVLKGDHDGAIRESQRAAELNPNGADVVSILAQNLFRVGRAEEAIPFSERVLRLEPNAPNVRALQLAENYRLAGRYEQLIPVASQVLTRNPSAFNAAWAHQLLAYAYVELGKFDEARDHVAKTLEAMPDRSIEGWSDYAHSFKDPTMFTRWAEVFRKAGLPEHPPLD